MNILNSTLLLVSHCAEVTVHTAYGCMSVQVTAPDVHEFQICPRSKYEQLVVLSHRVI